MDSPLKKLMAIGAHADDIEMNVGGTLAKYRDSGYEITYVMSTNNMSGGWSVLDADGNRRTRNPPWDEIMHQRKREAALGAAFFNAEAIHLDHPQRHYIRHDGQRESLSFGSQCPEGVDLGTPTILTAYEDNSCVQRLADLILQHQPEAILSHSLVTGNIEHIGSCLLVSKSYWKACESGYAGMLLYWQDISSAPVGDAYVRWDTFVDVSGYWQQKLDSIALHSSQIVDAKRLDFPPLGPACGCQYAEAFTIIGRGRPDINRPAFTWEILSNAR